MGPYQILILPDKRDLGLMTIKGYVTFLKASKLEPNHCVISMTYVIVVGRVLLHCRGAVCVFYNGLVDRKFKICRNSAKRLDSLTEYPKYDTKMHLIVILQSRIFGDSTVFLHCQYS